MAKEDAIKALKEQMKEYGVGNARIALFKMADELMPRAPDGFDKGAKCEWGQENCISAVQRESELEKVIDDPDFLSAHFLIEGAQIQKAVAMVTLKVAKSGLPAGSGWGSGFMISNTLFMTNNHVIPDTRFCNDVNMQFMYQDSYTAEPTTSEFFETNATSFFHTNAALDYTIVRLKRKPFIIRRPDIPWRPETGGPAMNPLVSEDISDSEKLEMLEYISTFLKGEAAISTLDPSRIRRIWGYSAGGKYGYLSLRGNVSYPQGENLNIIQHPQGRKKEVVVQRNTLSDVYTNVVHYTTDTDYGSSGSPVFNNTWDLMALHHSRVGGKEANEGIRIDKIVADLRNEFQASNPNLLTELGI